MKNIFTNIKNKQTTKFNSKRLLMRPWKLNDASNWNWIKCKELYSYELNHWIILDYDCSWIRENERVKSQRISRHCWFARNTQEPKEKKKHTRTHFQWKEPSTELYTEEKKSNSYCSIQQTRTIPYTHTLTLSHARTPKHFSVDLFGFFFLLHFISLPISYGYIEHFSYLVFQPTWMLIINDSIECLDLSPCILDHFQIQSSFIFPIFVYFTANEMATISINWFIFNQLMMPFLNFFFLHLIQI